MELAVNLACLTVKDVLISIYYASDASVLSSSLLRDLNALFVFAISLHSFVDYFSHTQFLVFKLMVN